MTLYPGIADQQNTVSGIRRREGYPGAESARIEFAIEADGSQGRIGSIEWLAEKELLVLTGLRIFKRQPLHAVLKADLHEWQVYAISQEIIGQVQVTVNHMPHAVEIRLDEIIMKPRGGFDACMTGLLNHLQEQTYLTAAQAESARMVFLGRARGITYA